MQPYETISRIKLRKTTHRFKTDMDKLRLAGPFILVRRHLHKLKLLPYIERKTFLFPLQIMDGSDFQKISLMVQIWNKKQEKRSENFLLWRSHSYVNRNLQKKKVFILFSNQPAARDFNSSSNFGPLCEKLVHPWFRTFYSRQSI